jgi:lipoate-protein ligase B
MTEAAAGIPFQVLELGLEEYGRTLERQSELVELRRQDRVPDTLILVEHPAVVTLGRAKTTVNLTVPKAELARRGIAYFEVSRGGDVTYHAPGQLVGYPIFDLRQHGQDVLRFCRGIESVLIGILGDYGIRARAEAGKAGVWVGKKKIASMGISLRRWVTFHGFALNVTTDLTGFQVIRPCGEPPEVMTSMERLLMRPVSLEEIRERVRRAFELTFGLREACPATG